ncbi:hypothetical protein DID77_03355, partial [Candidatus Marinamargulisbacteria bacterium SCGC AG-439-L15]
AQALCQEKGLPLYGVQVTPDSVDNIPGKYGLEAAQKKLKILTSKPVPETASVIKTTERKGTDPLLQIRLCMDAPEALKRFFNTQNEDFHVTLKYLNKANLEELKNQDESLGDFLERLKTMPHKALLTLVGLGNLDVFKKHVFTPSALFSSRNQVGTLECISGDLEGITLSDRTPHITTTVTGDRKAAESNSLIASELKSELSEDQKRPLSGFVSILLTKPPASPKGGSGKPKTGKGKKKTV